MVVYVVDEGFAAVGKAADRNEILCFEWTSTGSLRREERSGMTWGVSY